MVAVKGELQNQREEETQPKMTSFACLSDAKPRGQGSEVRGGRVGVRTTGTVNSCLTTMTLL
jgi:hypothetical protein